MATGATPNITSAYVFCRLCYFLWGGGLSSILRDDLGIVFRVILTESNRTSGKDLLFMRAKSPCVILISQGISVSSGLASIESGELAVKVKAREKTVELTQSAYTTGGIES